MLSFFSLEGWRAHLYLASLSGAPENTGVGVQRPVATWLTGRAWMSHWTSNSFLAKQRSHSLACWPRGPPAWGEQCPGNLKRPTAISAWCHGSFLVSALCSGDLPQCQTLPVTIFLFGLVRFALQHIHLNFSFQVMSTFCSSRHCVALGQNLLVFILYVNIFFCCILSLFVTFLYGLFGFCLEVLILVCES